MAEDKILNNDNLIVKGNFEATGDITATGGINGLTLSNGISGSNFNISGVNELSINDPGEGIVFTGTTNLSLAVVDDSSDNILNLSGTNAVLQVGGLKVATESYVTSQNYLTSVAFSDLTSKPSTLSGYGITDGVSLGTDNVFTGDNDFEGDLLRTNQRISSNQEYPLGHYTPGETVFELNPTWSNRELRQYFGNSNVSWDEVANAPGGYAVYINGSVSVGGAYNSGFPYIPIDEDGIYYMECWIKNAGTAQGHYMGSIDYEADFTAPESGAGNPGSYGYWVMSNYTGAADWTKKSGYITGHSDSATGAFETDATYWTPQALFNYSAGSGTRACWISGWKVIRVDHVGDRTFQDKVTFKDEVNFDTSAGSTNTHAKIVYGQSPSPDGSLNGMTQVNNYGADGYGLLLHVGYGESDNGGLKITDDGVMVWGASDENVFTVIDEDGRSEKFRIDNSGNTTISGNLTTNGYLTNTGGAKINVQNQQDGGTGRGIYMWDDTDTNWVIYMAQAGDGKAADGGSAVGGIDGTTQHAIRFRVNDNGDQSGFIWENSNDEALMQVTGDTGDVYARSAIYPSNQTTDFVNSTRIQNWQTAYGWGDHASANYLTSVDFTDIGAATRTNYTLKFKPPANSYAGFQFLGTDSQNAGYFLVRGTSDNDVYAAEGITLVGDQGWLTLAHRYSSDKGIRFMTGDSSASVRMTIASDGDISINNSLTVEDDLGVNGFIKDSLYKHSGSTNWRTKKYVRSVGITGGDIAGAWVQLSRVVISSTYEKVTIKYTINGYDDVSSGVEAIDVRYENGSTAQENHQCAWYSTDDHANLFSNVRSIRSASDGLSNTYDLYVQMAGDWRDSFTVVAESWTTHGDNASITYVTSNGSANEPSAGSNDIERGDRRWYTENDYMYLGSNRVYTTGDFSTSDFTYSAGTLLDLSSNTFSVDLTELTNNTAAFSPTQDHFVILDNGVQAKKLASSIFGSAAYEASTAFATASHNHSGVYVPEYEALQPSGSDKEMNVWRKTHAVLSDASGISTYIIIQTEVPQDNYSMGGFTLVYQDDYYSSGEGGEIKIYGYWNPESNGGFEGFRYECSNPYHTPTIEVCRNSSSGNTAFFISGEGGNYSQLIAKDLWLGYTASSATQQWGNGWTITQASDKTGYTNFNTLNRNDFPAITTDGSTPSLTGGVSAAEMRTLIGAQVAGSYLTAHPSISQASNVDNSGGTVIQDLTFDSNGHVTATGSVNLDNIYTSTDGTEDDYRFSLDLGNFSGTRWYKVGTVNTGSGGMRIRGMLTNHVESFGSCMVDLAIQGRDGNENDEIEITGHVHSLNENSGIAVFQSETASGSYQNWDVYVVATKYTQCQLDLTKVSCSFDTSKEAITNEPEGTKELDTSTLAEGNYVIRNSIAYKVFDSGINLSGGLSYTASTNTLSQTDNNTEYSVATTSADGLMSSTDKGKLDGVATGADVTPSWVPASDPSYLTSLPSHNHNSIYYTEEEVELALARINGWEAGYGSGTASNIRWNFAEEALMLKNDTDSSIGAVYKAVRMEAGETKRWTVMIKGSQVTTSGMYIRLYQHDGNLPDGKTHVSNDAQGTFVQEDDRGDSGWYENGAISDSWTVFEREYTAPADGYVSLVVLNWTGNGTESLFIKTPDIQTVYAVVEDNSINAAKLNVGSNGTSGKVLTSDGDGSFSWTSKTTNTNTTYSAGTGLDLTGTTFSVEPDLRDGITHVGVSSSNYITFDNTNNHIDFYVGGSHVARMESDGDLHIKGDVIAFSDLFA